LGSNGFVKTVLSIFLVLNVSLFYSINKINSCNSFSYELTRDYQLNKITFDSNKIEEFFIVNNLCEMGNHIQFIKKIDSLFLINQKNSEIYITNLYSVDLLSFYNLDLSSLNTNELIFLLKFADQFNDIDKQILVSKDVLIAVKDYWYNIISNVIDDHIQKNNDICNASNFNELRLICYSNGYGTDSKISNLEKLVFYIKRGKFTYVLNRIFYSRFHQSGITFLSILISIFILH
jgi:hypothetical protein